MTVITTCVMGISYTEAPCFAFSSYINKPCPDNLVERTISYHNQPIPFLAWKIIAPDKVTIQMISLLLLQQIILCRYWLELLQLGNSTEYLPNMFWCKNFPNHYLLSPYLELYFDPKITIYILTLVMLNKWRCHAHF